ncbi:MAG: ABC transporter ATP-binding protein [Thermoanaerobaculia bacterium]
MSVTVEAHDVHKSYRDGSRRVQVLAGVELQASAGEMLAIVGPSGSGKSTLLNLLGALDEPDQGEIIIGGEKLATLGRRLAAFRNRTLGFIFQFHRLLPDFDALENVMLPGRIAGREPRWVRRRAAELLDEVGLADRGDHFPGQLSGGERQRVALCRALLLEPPLLLADEPTGNLDPASAEQVFEMLLELQRRHRTTAVLVTHNPALAARCDRILRLEGGTLHLPTAVTPDAAATTTADLTIG